MILGVTVNEELAVMLVVVPVTLVTVSVIDVVDVLEPVVVVILDVDDILVLNLVDNVVVVELAAMQPTWAWHVVWQSVCISFMWHLSL